VIKSLYKLEFEEEEPMLTEPTQQKAANKVITLHDDEPEMVARMLLCLYASDYPTQLKERNFSGYPTVEEFMKKGFPKFQTDSFEHEANPLLVHSKMYAIADKYNMPSLQAICVKKFEVDIDDYWKVQCLVNALPHVYSSTSPSQTALKQKAAALVQKSYSAIIHKPLLMTKLETACVQNGQLGWDVLSNLFNRRSLRCAKCNDCVAFDNGYRFEYGGVCVCGLTQLCGSGLCSNLVKEKWVCPSCKKAGLGKVKEKETPEQEDSSSDMC
jgi:hypothetical protein